MDVIGQSAATCDVTLSLLDQDLQVYVLGENTASQI